MEKDKNQKPRQGDHSVEKPLKSVKRRDVLKSLATVPVLGVLAYGWWRKKRHENFLNNQLSKELRMSYESPPAPVHAGKDEPVIRLGLIGFGIRGPQIVRGAGFIHPEEIDTLKKAASENSADKRYQNYMEQEDMNLVVNGVCDVFDVHAERAIQTGANINRVGTDGKPGKKPKRYRTYKELLAADDIDAVIISTPDHWHGPMTIEAAKHGKHVYCEKPMTWTVPETYEVVKAVKESNIIFQLGHQGRQTASYVKAKEAIEKNILGKISLIEVTTNRNSPNGAWVYPIHPDASQKSIDWKQFIGQAPWHEFSLERFFRWRCWWDYSTGLSGDLLTHEYDAMNQILGLGIPDSATSSGGIYYYKDGRTVPDVLHTVFEFSEKELTLMYSATLASNKDRGKMIMGHDASMKLGNTIIINADPESTRYKNKMNNGVIDPSLPIYSYIPGQKNVDAVTSATVQYFADRGLLYTYRGGKRVDTTHLHLHEWINCIRTGKQPSCNIDQGFQEAMTAHMGTIAYKEKRRVFWDRDNQKII